MSIPNPDSEADLTLAWYLLASLRWIQILALETSHKEAFGKPNPEPVRGHSLPVTLP